MDTTSQDAASVERPLDSDPESRVFNICGLCKFRFHEGQPIIALDRNNSTLPLTWNDKYYPDFEIFHAHGQQAFHAGCFKIAGDVVFDKAFLESCTWNLVWFGFHSSFTQPRRLLLQNVLDGSNQRESGRQSQDQE
ncbi:hypothetical protein FDENT_13006 [Fusarium denticulatum]|uniref:Uncharacterized protein n=1 Tax=Fusarium denticulatum TaxID=48507 RepID=A0A8H5T790_9HYPO|nr:hypothetical protein FDENT_13006 [Fusarium denticulatum]